MSKKYIVVNEHEYNLGAICPPNEFGGNLVKLKNEFVFAKYSLEVQQQRLLFNAMSYFDINPFLKDEVVQETLRIDGSPKWDFNKVTQTLTDEYYSNVEKRSIVLSIREILRSTGSRNYKALDKAVDTLQSLTMIVDEMTPTRVRVKKTISPIEGAAKISSTQILITFTKEFMPYLLAVTGYQSIDLDLISGFLHKHSSRYYHWSLYALGLKAEESVVKFDISIDSIRERLGISDKEHQRSFFSRVVKVAVDEINAKTPIYIHIDKVIKKDNKGRSLRGNPVSKLTFKVYRDKVAALNATKDIIATIESRYNMAKVDFECDGLGSESDILKIKKELDEATAELRLIESLNNHIQNEPTKADISDLSDELFLF
ncbi:replication initiation protein [Vibrio aestuarianus]|uniref:replication initiation protein n=1 Tax=Vibrio aestuarianus TaxID=28171 RepID=UPI00237CC676|nr:replication initiation protein [Vibrio aestuarianus]MDE1239811.1 replication initiation protein [Vibrio aestuarianus]